MRLGPTCAHEFSVLSSPQKEVWGAARLSFTARIERGPSEGARSASKKDGLADPLILPLPHLTLRPLPQPFNVPLVLQHNEPGHQHREQHKDSTWAKQRGDNGK